MKPTPVKIESVSKSAKTKIEQKQKDLSKKNLKQLQSIFQSAPAATAVLEGPEHKYILANKAYQKLFNRQAKDFFGKSIYEVFPELKDSGAFELVDRVFETGGSFITPEYALLVDAHHDGVLRKNFYHFSMEPLKNDLDEIYAVVAMIYDITEQVESRKKIEESEKQKAFLLKLSDALRLLSSPQQIKIKAMQILGEHLNVSRCYYAEVINDGKYCVIDNSFSSGLGAIDGTYQLEEFGKAKVAALQRGEVILTTDVANDTSVTQEERDKNLEMQIHAYINVPLLKDNKLISLLGVNQSVVRNWTPLDLTFVQETAERTWAAVERAKAVEALRNSEEKYRTLFTSMDQGFTLCELIRDAEGKAIDFCMLEVNPNYEEQTGISREMVLGKPLMQLFPSLNKWIEIYTSVVDNQRPAVFENYFEETDRWFAIKAYPVEKERFAVLYTNITKRKQAELKLIESEKHKAFLLKLSDALRPLSSPEEIEGTATKIALDFMDADRCHYVTIEGDNAIILRDAVRKEVPSVAGVYPISSFALFRAVMDSGHHFIVDDVNTTDIIDEDLKQLCLQLQSVAFINVPVIKNSKPVGLLSLVQSKPRKWTETEVQLTIETAERTWAAIEKAIAEESLHKSEEKYRTLFTSMDQGFTLCELIRNKEGIGIDLSILEVNPTYERQTGVTKEMVIGKPLLQVFPSLGNWIEKYAAVVDNQCPVEFEQHFEDTDRWFLIKAYPIEKDKFAVLFKNITERKLAEAKLIESEKEIRKVKEQLELSIGAGKIGVWFWDVKKDILTWSNEQKEMYGFSATEVITKAAQFNALIFPEDLNRIQIDQRTGILDHEYDFRIIRKNDGELRWIKSRARNTLDPQGVLQFISGVNIDVTEQVLALNKIKESEIALAQQKQLLESVTENTDMALFLMDEKQYCIYMNQAAEKMTGFTLKELKGKQLHYYVHHSHPDGSPFPLEECPIDMALPTQNKMKGEDVFVHKEGSFYPVAFTASPIMANGIVIGTVIEVRETTEDKRKEQELKQSESMFRNLAETLPQMVWVMNSDGSMEYGSKNWKEYSGIDDVMEAWNYMMHPDDRERLTAYWEHVFVHGKGYQHEMRLKSKEGIYRWFYSVGEPVLDDDGKVSKWVGSLTDIQKQKYIEEMLEKEVAVRTKELEQKNTELQNMNNELEAFNYISSHDLQEPLRKIQTFAGRIIAKETDLSDTAKDYFSRMQNAATRMQILIQDLLFFSRLSKSERKFEITVISKLIDEEKEEFKEVIESKHALIEATELCEVNIIPFQFRQLMHNLISNALKFSKVDVPPHIIIKSIIAKGRQLNNDKLLPNAKYCHISFADNGIGFDKRFSEKIFGLFQKLHAKEEFAGTGIGLAIVKKIVDNHNGIVTVESELGKGATFNIYLPHINE